MARLRKLLAFGRPNKTTALSHTTVEENTTDNKAKPIGHIEREWPSVQREGLTILTTSAAESDGYDIDVVVVHGLCGDPELTWLSSDKTFFWPWELAKAVPNARIMLFGYDADITSRMVANLVRPSDIGRQLLSGLSLKRYEKASRRPLIMIGHSLGGLVMKYALKQAYQEDDNAINGWKQIYNSTKALIFFGTPHLGSTVNNRKRIRTLQAMAGVYGKQIPPKLADELGSHSHNLFDLSYDIRRTPIWEKGQLDVLSFAEKTIQPGAGELVVDETSAKCDHPNETILPIQRDHSQMVKFASLQDASFEEVIRRIRLLVERASVLQYDPRLFSELSTWLKAPDSSLEHSLARQSHQKGTSLWLLKHEQYQAFRSGSVRHVWLHGKSGSGKTVLCSTAIEDLRLLSNVRKNNIGFSMFYFTFSNAEKQSYDHLLCSLASQLCWRAPGFDKLWQAYTAPNRPGRPDRLLLESALIQSMNAFLSVYICIDGLDECPDAADGKYSILAGFERLIDAVPGMKLFATSQPDHRIEKMFTSLAAAQICIDSHSEGDVAIYVQEQLETHFMEAGWTSSTRDMIRDFFKDRADGMFRYVACQLEELKLIRAPTKVVIQRVLSDLPKTLDGTYARILQRISRYEMDTVIVILRWLIASRRPLSLVEVAEACAIQASNQSRRGAVEQECRLDPANVKQLLRGLILVYDEIREHELFDGGILLAPVRRLRLAHGTVQTYLLSSRAGNYRIEELRAHQYLSDCCLTYIGHYSDHGAKTSTREDFTTFPLLQYAASSWYIHSKESGIADDTNALRLLTSPNWKRDWLMAYQPESHRTQFDDDKPFFLSSVLYAINLGLEDIAIKLCEQGEEVNDSMSLFGTPLQKACAKSADRLVSALLLHGADPKVDQRSYRCTPAALYLATKADNANIVRMLLEYGADPNAKDHDNRPAICEASCNGNVEIVRALVDAGCDVRARDKGLYGSEAIHLAVISGHRSTLEVVDILVKAGARLDSPCTARCGRPEGTPLQLALAMLEQTVPSSTSSAGPEHHQNIVAYFHTRGIKVSDQEKKTMGASSVHIAVHNSDLDAVRSFVEDGADTRSRSTSWFYTGTPLDIAIRHPSRRNRDQIIELLYYHHKDQARKTSEQHEQQHNGKDEGEEEEDQLHIAIFCGDFPRVQQLLHSEHYKTSHTRYNRGRFWWCVSTKPDEPCTPFEIAESRYFFYPESRPATKPIEDFRKIYNLLCETYPGSSSLNPAVHSGEGESIKELE